MPSALGLAGTLSLTTSPQVAYSQSVDGGKYQQATFTNRDATNDACVNIPELHGEQYFPIAPGQPQAFTVRNGFISAINVKSSASTVIITGGINATV